MAKKDSKKKAGLQKGILGNWIVRNLLLAAAVIVGLLLVAQVGLGLLTRHNQTVTVPDFTNMTVAEAHEVARDGHVGVKVTDSVFVRRLGAGLVYRQSPKAGATVKKGRSIFLTINSIVPRKVVMPNLIGYSLNEARAELNNRGLSLGKLNYTQDIATNNVLRQTVRGRNVRAGDLVISGSDVDLTLGLSRDERPTVVPRVIGQKYVSAVDALHDRYLNVGRVRFDSDVRTYADSVNAVVYRQDGLGQTRTYGSAINLYLTLDPEKIPAERQEAASE
jgi:beta-lactam-binding protein with PASTA domain